MKLLEGPCRHERENHHAISEVKMMPVFTESGGEYARRYVEYWVCEHCCAVWPVDVVPDMRPDYREPMPAWVEQLKQELKDYPRYYQGVDFVRGIDGDIQ